MIGFPGAARYLGPTGRRGVWVPRGDALSGDSWPERPPARGVDATGGLSGADAASSGSRALRKPSAQEAALRAITRVTFGPCTTPTRWPALNAESVAPWPLSRTLALDGIVSVTVL